jgi:hypothetical protein
MLPLSPGQGDLPSKFFLHRARRVREGFAFAPCERSWENLPAKVRPAFMRRDFDTSHPRFGLALEAERKVENLELEYWQGVAG